MALGPDILNYFWTIHRRRLCGIPFFVPGTAILYF